MQNCPLNVGSNVLVGSWGFMSWQHLIMLSSHQDGYQLATVRIHGDHHHDIPLNHIILTLSQPVLALS